MKVAIMQPYIFPYIGYFQLVQAVDDFVFLDNVNFIKRGYVNRNTILINNKPKLITFPCLNISQNKYIQHTEIDITSKAYSKILKSIKLAYKKAPYYKPVMNLIEKTLDSDSRTISELAMISVKNTATYLQLETNFRISSEEFKDFEGVNPSDQLIQICKDLNSKTYINAIGGQKLYNKPYFAENNVDLFFLKPSISTYRQFNEEFVGYLSMIDVLMFNDIKSVREMLTSYDLI